MAGRSNHNGQNWHEKGPQNWNSSSEPDLPIDVWDPNSVSSNNYTSSNATSQIPMTTQPISMTSYQQDPTATSYEQRNDWGTIETPPVPQQAAYRPPNRSMQDPPPANISSYNSTAPNSQFYEPYQSRGSPTATLQNEYNYQSNYSQQQNSVADRNTSYQSSTPPTHNRDWPAGSWRSQSNVGPDQISYNIKEPYYPSATAKKFSNPLMNASNSAEAESAEGLIKQLHIQGQRDQRNINNIQKNPTILSKSSLAMLKNDLQQAAVAFESAENLELARRIHLGIVDVTEDLGQKVVVSNLSAEAADFVPRAQASVKPEHVPEQAPQDQEDALIENLKFFIENILKQPGNFDELSSILIDQVKYYLHSDETVKEMVKIIFTKAIDEDNFKYLGARLCDKLTMPKILSNFRSIFLNHFQAEFKKIRDSIDKKQEADINKIHGFVMFMAEIFIHIKINGTPVVALGRSLSKTLDNLLLDPTTKNVTFVCKVLKLAGGKLLDAFQDNEKDKENFQKIFTILQQLSDQHKKTESEDSKTVVLLISSVSRLRNSNWGRTKSNSRPKSSIEDPEEYGDVLSEVDQNYYMNEPVFFTPEGVQYTAAEAQIPEFYQQHLAKYRIANIPLSEDGESSLPWSQSADAFDDFVPSDEEFEFYRQDSQDSEYSREYEKFLAESNQLL